MKKVAPEITEYYDRVVIEMIAEKYGYSLWEALRLFIHSETHEFLEDEKYGMAESFGALFDIWEAEMVTGNPRNSIYIRGD